MSKNILFNHEKEILDLFQEYSRAQVFRYINKAKENYQEYEIGFSTTLEPNYSPVLGHYDSLSEIALKNEFAKKILNIYSINNN